MRVGRRWESLGATVLLLCAVAPAAATAEEPAALRELSILFKQDPRLFGGTYGGARWLSPPTFTSAVQPGAVGTVDLKVRGVDADGRVVAVHPEWTTDDPDRVTVTPAPEEGHRITVEGPGQSTLTVAAQGVSRELSVTARSLGGAIIVEVRQPASEPPPPDVPPRAAATGEADGAAGVLEDRMARSSYAMGLEMGRRLRETSVELDVDLVSRGVRDALAGEGVLLTEEERKAALLALRADYQTRRGAARQQLADGNKKAGEAFLETNAVRDGVVTLESGVQYRVLRAGAGPKPAADDRVVCRYRGSLVDGREFDSNYGRKKPTTLSLKRAVQGWREALQLMPVGSRWEIVIPWNLAYGERGTRSIGPNETLIFEVELLSIL